MKPMARGRSGRVLGSEEFRASPNLTAFLRFIVERTLEGREDTIKAYTVATEVLGRPESFDPQVDPIVRVEATRLQALAGALLWPLRGSSRDRHPARLLRSHFRHAGGGPGHGRRGGRRRLFGSGCDGAPHWPKRAGVRARRAGRGPGDDGR